MRWPLAGQLRLLPRLVLVLAAAAAAVPARAQGECEMNPTLEACKGYTVAEAVLQRDLERICAGSTLGAASYSGWPAACTLWQECQQGRAMPASCQPLGLLQTACNETPELGACMPYLLMCAPQSVVEQCTQQPPARGLRSAMQLYTAVQSLCPADLTATAPPREECSNCSAQTFDPDKVTVQALQANCGDPLGTLSAICLGELSLSGSSLSSPASQYGNCSTWADFCLSEAGSGFWGLCGGEGVDAPARAPAAGGTPARFPQASPPPPRLPQPTPDRVPAQGQPVVDFSPPPPSPPSPATVPALPPPPQAQPATPGGGGTGGPAPSCYENPQQPACRSFQQTDEASVADIQRLCDSMPSLVGCSLWQQCSSGAASGSYCQPFSVLGSMCVSNPATDGCQHWAALCTTPGGVVEQCITAAPIRNVVATNQALDVAVQACSTRGASLAGCEQCAAGWRSCTTSLTVLSQLCVTSPGTSQCSNFEAMCAEAGTTFSSLCEGGTRTGASGIGGGGNGTAPGTTEPVVKMYLHASMSAIILFQSWVPTFGGAYVASCLAIIALAVAVQALKALNLQLEARWAAQLAAQLAPTPSSLPRQTSSIPEYGRPSRTTTMDFKDSRRSSIASTLPMLRPSMRQSSIAHPLQPLQPVQEQEAQQAQRFITKQELSRNVVRSAVTGGVVLLDYLLVLVVVTFNLGLIISATLGFCLGALVFGHLGERVAAAGTSAGTAGASSAPMVLTRTSLQPTSENDGDTPFITSHQPLPQHTLGINVQ